MTITLHVQLWPREGRREELARYEDEVLALLPEHGGRLVLRVGPMGGEDAPQEIQVIEFDSEAGLEAYLSDPRRTAASTVRDRAIERTVMNRVEPI